jgi:hypothetical protein
MEASGKVIALRLMRIIIKIIGWRRPAAMITQALNRLND